MSAGIDHDHTTGKVRRMVKRTCRVIQRNGQPCGREYRVQAGSKAKGCPDCCPRLDLFPDRAA